MGLRQPRQPLTLNPLRVLIVEDDDEDEDSVRQVMARWIQGAGHEILEAESADAALQVMEKQPAA